MGLIVMSLFLVVFSVFHSFSIFSNIEKTNVKECNINSRRVARTPKMENFATVFNSFANYCCKALHLRYLQGSWLHLWNQWNMNKLQQEKIATCAECNRRRMKNEIIATCKSTTSNSAIRKKSATRKKVQREKITIQKV